jgi:hypothetical protein
MSKKEPTGMLTGQESTRSAVGGITRRAGICPRSNKQSTGEKGHHDKHTGSQKQEREEKKQNDNWVPKGETNAEREAREERLKDNK